MRVTWTQLPGIAGLLMILCALLLLPVKDGAPYYFFGAFLMLSTAVLERHVFFIVLQIVVLTGTLLGVLEFPRWSTLSLLTVISSSAVLWCYKKGFLDRSINWLGCISLCVMAFSYAMASTAGFIVSGLGIACFSYCDYSRGVKVALHWFILNICFVFASIYALLSAE